MMERLTYWKCPSCRGTGRVAYGPTAIACFHCAGTGNALVDGREAAHRRRLTEIERSKNRALEQTQPISQDHQ